MNIHELVMLGIQVSILGTVFCFGLQAKWQDARELAHHHGLWVRSLISILLVMPIAVIAIRAVMPLPLPTQIVLMALAISPIPPLLPKKEGKAGGLANYGLGLMLTVGLLAVVTVPLAVELLGRYLNRPFHVSSAAVAKPVLAMIAAPLLLGMLVRAWQPGIASHLLRPIRIGATVLLTACALGIVVTMMPTLKSLIHDGTFWAMLLFACIGLLSGHLLGGPVGEERTVLALSTASRHPAIALVIAKGSFPDEHFLPATVLLYLLVSTLVVLPYVQWRKRSGN